MRWIADPTAPSNTVKADADPEMQHASGDPGRPLDEPYLRHQLRPDPLRNRSLAEIRRAAG